ncbi:XYPPX repeat family protein [Tritrichomonas foetus]|uniref:XYPPX repeat family protein n=1 Tax=Tritrichomonas foetus TaxID=1144522 RepID=A0A1J4K0T2_9EUKA|nr:XYPPX repeat family protein [Tritrichomonas foetus]|eukprot:OHT04983.1 XYPPX repeat family protein [Tritrichomonas foetus]
MQLHVRVVEALEIAKMDLNKSDPYCIVSVPQANSSQRTKVKDNSLTPRWNEEFHFTLPNPASATLHVEMKDKDLVKDDKMASLDVQLCSIPVGMVVDNWYNMTPASGVKKGGRLHLVIHIAPQGAPAFIMQQPGAYTYGGMPMQPGMQPYPGAPMQPGMQQYPGAPMQPGMQPYPGAPMQPGMQPGMYPQQQGYPGGMMSFGPPPRPPGMSDKDYKKLCKAQKKAMKKMMKGKK